MARPNPFFRCSTSHLACGASEAKLRTQMVKWRGAQPSVRGTIYCHAHACAAPRDQKTSSGQRRTQPCRPPASRLCVVSMTDDDDIRNFLDAQDRALAVHETGHAVVAHALGAEVLFVEIDVGSGNGWTRSSEFADNIKNLAICVAGCRAEHALEAAALRKTKKADFRHMQKLLSRFPEAERRAARAEGYKLADVILKAKSDVVHRLAETLLACHRIEGEELAALLAGGG